MTERTFFQLREGSIGDYHGLEKLAKKTTNRDDAQDYSAAADFIKKGDIQGLNRSIARLDTFVRDEILKHVPKNLWKKLGFNAIVRQGKGSPYPIKHQSYTSAVNAAIAYAEKQGYEVDKEDVGDKIGLGPKKPSSGKTNRISVKLAKNGKVSRHHLHLQIYNADNKFYELNTYVS